MNCKSNSEKLEIEANNKLYCIEFGQVQIEITGRCNMGCEHCRADKQGNKDMPLNQIEKVMTFARRFSPNHKEVIISGGEPLLHKEFEKVLRKIRELGGEFITITTNGSVLKKEHLNLIKELKFKRVILSVSLDSLDQEVHDNFRKYPGAFKKALDAIRLITRERLPEITPSIRCTLKPSQIKNMEEMVSFAKKEGCKRVSFSAIHPAGKAIERKDLWMNKSEKKRFIEEVYRLKKKYPSLNVTTNDPLKCLLRGKNDFGKEGQLVFDGCGAGVITFNVNSNGIMTPCALLNIPLMNIFSLTVDEIVEKYRSLTLVKNMLEMDLKGKCSNCERKYQCGGCRARALIQKGDFLEEDPHCWI